MADFERLEAEPWKNWQGIDPKAAPLKSKLVIYPAEPDTQARSSWRQNAPPKHSIALPKDLIIEKTSSKTAGNTGFKISDFLKDFTIDPQVHVAPKQQRNKQNLIVLEFWGDEDLVRKTIQEIRAWIEENTKKDRRWAKVQNVNPQEMQNREDAFLKQARIEEFRRLPPENGRFPRQGVFQWPPNAGHPDKILGKSLEALDPIRLSNRCYITFDSATSSLRAMGTSDAKIGRAVLRLRGVYFQVVAWLIRHEKQYFSITLKRADLPVHVKLFPRDQTNAPAMIPRAHGYVLVPLAEDERFEVSAPELIQLINNVTAESTHVERKQRYKVSRLKGTIIDMISRLIYFKGNLSMRIRLGQFILNSWRDKSNNDQVFTRSEFEDMLDHPRASGEVTERCCPDDAEAGFFRQLSKATKLLKPMSIWGVACPGDRMQPFYKAEFVVQKGEESFVYETTYQGESQAEMACLRQTWSKSGSKDEHSQRLIDASLFDVSKQSSGAWQFEIVAGHPITKKTLDSLLGFSNTIQLDIDPNKLSSNPEHWPTDPFFSFRRMQRTTMKSLVEKVVFRYRLKDSSYIIELAKARKFTFTGPPTAQKPCLNESPLELQIVAEHWEDKFDRNAHLGVGEGVKWEVKLPSSSAHPDWNDKLTSKAYADMFFPTRGLEVARYEERHKDGFTRLVDALNEISAVLQIGDRSEEHQDEWSTLSEVD